MDIPSDACSNIQYALHIHKVIYSSAVFIIISNSCQFSYELMVEIIHILNLKLGSEIDFHLATRQTATIITNSK